MTNVYLPKETWIDLYAATGITVGTQISVLNISTNDIRLVEAASQPDGNDDFVSLAYRAGTAMNAAGDAGAWALCVGEGAVDVREVTP